MSKRTVVSITHVTLLRNFKERKICYIIFFRRNITHNLYLKEASAKI